MPSSGYDKLHVGPGWKACPDKTGTVLPQPSPVLAQRKCLAGVLTAIGVYSVLGAVLSAIVLVLNIAITLPMAHTPSLDSGYTDDDVAFATTPGIWFGVLNGLLCGVALTLSLWMTKYAISKCFLVTGVVLSVFFAIMMLMAAVASALSWMSSSRYAYQLTTQPWGRMFAAIYVFAGLAGLVNGMLSVLMAIAVFLLSACSSRRAEKRCSEGPAAPV